MRPLWKVNASGLKIFSAMTEGPGPVDGARDRRHQGGPAPAHERGHSLARGALDLAEEPRLPISRWFTSCPPAMHRRVTDDSAAYPRGFALVVQS
ncbi:hypothetical protein GCM10010339_68510 [Streptomyces alanosinicus]|uniref:Uncharacterized protein n=1 Tax=Streptomyces alanosinicus TaxID=68171 RepID=A0A919D537_9ACTN|nr:hypothetical protein GCM10010339_68510 [Streptomyces alanosinicus]